MLTKYNHINLRNSGCLFQVNEKCIVVLADPCILLLEINTKSYSHIPKYN